MPSLDRAVIVVLDGVGVGNAPDAGAYGDEGASSIEHCAAAIGGLALPTMGSMGLGNITPVLGTPPAEHPVGGYGRMAEAAAGKDSTTGHWEMTGVVLAKPLPTYPHGFPPDLVARFEAAIGRGTLGNKAASGTAIIEELGAEHMRTGKPILYTSADSVFQLAALDATSARLSTDALMALDAQVELDGRDPRAVARSWLREQGLLRAGAS